eukprot:g6058.t1
MAETKGADGAGGDAAGDRAGLIALYEGTGPWDSSWKWPVDDPTKPISKWKGVKCDEEGRVVELNLRLAELKGAAPADCLLGLTKLVNLELRSNEKLTALPDLPAQLQTLDCYECKKLTALPDLPAQLQTLNLELCWNLTALPDLPAQLQTLNLEHCWRLTAMPDLPAQLQTLNLEYCKTLTAMPDLPSQLQTLNGSSCLSRTALIALYEGTGPWDWKWPVDDPTKPISEWTGVKCDEEGRVVELYLGKGG